ncbi:hypothetical protein GCM10007063_33920 [Lentibacillus kapialis]|uniref:Uncharacterized protein n=2 Tax=Lentibacillus kapialis TaxID=340214 RepID=A0A917Q4C9_9BACI|nr:hypothetical protein GCM10007063_33920 [Lentibacillus kapialis]
MFSRSSVIHLAAVLNKKIQASDTLKIHSVLLTSRLQGVVDPNEMLEVYLGENGAFTKLDVTEFRDTNDILHETDIIITDTFDYLYFTNVANVEVILINQFVSYKDMNLLFQKVSDIRNEKLKKLVSQKKEYLGRRLS